MRRRIRSAPAPFPSWRVFLLLSRPPMRACRRAFLGTESADRFPETTWSMSFPGGVQFWLLHRRPSEDDHKKKQKITIPYYLFAASSESVRKAASPLSPCRRKRPYVVKIILVKIVAPSWSSMHSRVPVSMGGAETGDEKTTGDSEG